MTENTSIVTTTPWRDDFVKLAEFIEANPGISIKHNAVIIPSDVKEQFYQLFDIAKASFVKQFCPAAAETGLELSEQYQAVNIKILNETGLSLKDLTSDLTWFLKDPVDGLARLIFNPMFKLLANQFEVDEFEQRASTEINSAFAKLFRDGYQRWVALSIIRRLSPSKSYLFPAVDAIQDGLLGEGHESPGYRRGDVPGAQEKNDISFDQHPIITFIVPRITVHSRRTNTFVAMHSDFREAEWTATIRNSEMEWITIDDLKAEYGIVKIRPDMMKKIWYELEPILPDFTFYSSTEVNNLSLVADFQQMLRPEITIVVIDSHWDESTDTEALKRRLLSLRPSRGAFVVFRQEIPPAAVTALGGVDGIELLHVGYDENALEAIISRFPPAP